MKTLALFGCYGIENLGDDIILLSLLDKLSAYKRWEKIEILSYGSNYKQYKEKYKNISVTRLEGNSIRKLLTVLKCISSNDGFLIGGGGLFPKESFLNLIKIYIFTLYSKIKNKKVAIHGVEITSVMRMSSIFLWKLILKNVDYFYARNEYTYKKLGPLAIKNNVFKGTDVTFGLPVRDLSENRSHKVIISLAMPWNEDEMQDFHFKKRYELLCRQLIELSLFFISNGYYCIFLPFFKKKDIYIIKDVVKGLPSHGAEIVKELALSPMQKKDLFSDACFALSMRFHSVLFSIQSQTPFWAIAYSPKTSNLLKEYEMDNFSEFGIRDAEFFYSEFDMDEKQIDKIKEFFLNIDKQVMDDIKILNKKYKELSKVGDGLLEKWVK